MRRQKLSRLELQILEILWARGNASIREVQESFPEPRPAYTTIQTTVYRMEAKNAVKRIRKIGNAHLFEPLVSRDTARRRLLDDILSLFGGRAQPMMAQLAEVGKLTREDVRELERTIAQLEKKRKAERSRKGRPRRSPRAASPCRYRLQSMWWRLPECSPSGRRARSMRRLPAALARRQSSDRLRRRRDGLRRRTG